MIHHTRSGRSRVPGRIDRAADRAGVGHVVIGTAIGLRAAASIAVLVATIGVFCTNVTAMQSPRERLADAYVRVARIFVGQEQLTVAGLNGARLMIEQAVALDQHDPQKWHLALEIAMLGEFDDLKAQAVRELARLDPNDDVIRLMRINLTLEDIPTADELLAAYRRWLSEPNINQIGDAVASRLAMDMALLQRRRGDTEGFAESLARSTALDPANVDAAAMAAGYFQQHVDDAYGLAELLVSLVMADPVHFDAQTSLAGHLLRHGAYKSADRMYTLARDARLATGAPITAEFLADLAIAQWASGRTDAALRTIREYQRAINERAQFQRLREDPLFSQAELGRITAIADPVVATVRAAIYEGMDGVDEEQADATFEQAMTSYTHWIDRHTEEADDASVARVRELAYHRAWIAVWLGRDVERAREMITLAQDIEPMSETAVARYDAWLAFRAGDIARAQQQFAPLVEDDLPSRLGLGLVHLERGERREAARHLLIVARQQPGTLIGVWAAERLAQLLGRRVPIDEMAGRLNELIDSVPSVIDRMPSEPRVAFTARIRPAVTTFDAYTPVEVIISITNNCPFPLAINADGPIHNQIAMYIDIRSAANPRVQQAGPLFVNIGRRLRLMPRETLEVPVDLRQTRAASVLLDTAIAGTNLDVRMITNHTLTGQGIVVPGALGIETRSGSFRIDGARISGDWIADALAGINDVGDPVNVRNIALLMQVIGRLDEIRDEEVAGVVRTAREQLISAFSDYRPSVQAWLLSVIRNADQFEPILDVARQSQDPHVQMMYLIHHLRDASDPMVDAGRRSEHPAVRTLAGLIADVIADITGASNAGPSGAAPSDAGSRNPGSPNPGSP